jgi:uncharacterized membrane protein
MAPSNQSKETSLKSLLRATFAGGLLFLLPVVLLAVVLGHAIQIAAKFAKPISDILPMESIIGVPGETAVAVLMLILISLGAGLATRTNAGKRIMRWSESSILGGLPQYQLVKSMAEGLAQVENVESVKPVLVSIEGGWQIAYLLEPLRDGWVTVFLPQAPTLMSGNVMYLPAHRVRPLAITLTQAMAIIKRMGVGSAGALRGANLELPEGA